MDDVPTINVSRAPHGHPDNPHVVRSPSALDCTECGPLAAVLLERLAKALGTKTEATGG